MGDVVKKKRVMILGANNFLLPLIRKSKELGYETIVVSPVREEPGFAYADEKIYINLTDKEAVLSAAKELGIDGITTDQAETPIRTVAYVGEKLNLPGIGIKQAELFTNKYLQRKKCKEIGIDTIRFHLAENAEDAAEFFGTLDGNAIMKPIDSAGSRGVVQIRKRKDIFEHFDYSKEASKSGGVIIEDFIDGKELMIDGVTVNNTYQTLVCGEYQKCMVDGVFSEYIGKYPANINRKQYEDANALVKQVVEGFGLQCGRTHTEVKINERGVWLMETAARGGGRYISSCTVPMMTDFSSEEFLLKACMGEVQEVPKIEYRDLSCGYVSMFLPVGEVVSVEGLDAALHKPYAYSHNCENICVGMRTSPFADKIEGKFIHILAKDDEDFYNKIEDIKNTVKIKIKTTQGIEDVIWEG
ncbi:MAG: ATP-grasp domain-containing protein [Bacteroides sp.]|nr:ATP-grasp domain-containing protein [Bacteroides sp.]MCM1549029.1 ATP-grasp domain-containing protein [Clostridium sp.]